METLLCNDSAVPDDLEDPVPIPGQSALPGMSMVDWYQLQRNDSSLARVIGILETGDETFDRKSEEPEVVLFLREKSKLLLVEGVLYRRASLFKWRPAGQMRPRSNLRVALPVVLAETQRKRKKLIH